MRQQIVIEKRKALDEAESKRRQVAVEMLRDGVIVAQFVRRTGAARSSCDQLKTALTDSSGSDETLQKRIDTDSNRAGRTPSSKSEGTKEEGKRSQQAC